MQPTVGRIVHYTLSANDVEQVDAALPQRDGGGQYMRNPVREGQTFPAVVVATWGGEAANLQVFLDGPCSYWATSRTLGEGPGHWAPRV